MSGQPWESLPALESVFNTAWANNGDHMSRSVPHYQHDWMDVTPTLFWRFPQCLTLARAYAGTSALKGDYTRTGKRTQMGMMADGVNALARFYKNNFLDRDRQLLIGAAPTGQSWYSPHGAHEAAQ